MHHIVFAWDEDEQLFSLTVDGITDVRTGLTFTPVAHTNLVMGAYLDGSTPASGTISNVFITNKYGTPQNPVILGSGALHTPLVDKT